MILPDHMEDPKLKTEASSEFFLPEYHFKTSSVINFPKKHPDFGGLKKNPQHETQT